MTQQSAWIPAFSVVERLLWTLLLLLAAAMLGDAAAQPTPSRDLKTIVDRGALQVSLTRFDLPAFHWRSGELFAGPEVELARQLARALGVAVKFVDEAPSFDSVIDAVATGRADIGISKLSQTYYRLMRVRFSEPYITLRHALLYERAGAAARAKDRPPKRRFVSSAAGLGRSAAARTSISAVVISATRKLSRSPIEVRPSKNS